MDSLAPEFVVAPFISGYSGKGRVILRSQVSGEAAEIGLHLLQVLVKLGSPRSLDEHVQEALKKCSLLERLYLFRDVVQYSHRTFKEIEFGFGSLHSMLVRAFGDLEKRGLILSTAAVKLRCTSKEKRAPISIRTIGIPTCNRPEQLQRCLTSLEAQLRGIERVQVLVADDSRAPEVLAANERVLSSFARCVPAEVLWITRAERASFADCLSAQGVPPEVAQFLLLGSEAATNTCGANRNSLLLASAGEPLWMLDDDTIADMRYGPRARGSLRFITQPDPYAHRFFESYDEIQAQTFPTAENLLQLGSRYLGRTTGDLLADIESNRYMDLAEGNSYYLSLLYREQGEVAAVLPGIYGDSGSNSILYRFYLKEADCRREFPDNQRYQKLRNSHLVFKAPEMATIAPADVCMSTAMCLNNSRFLPPFFPIKRNQDAIFGALVKLIQPTSLFAYLPESLGHYPAEARAVQTDLTDGDNTFQHDSLIEAVADSIGSFPRTNPIETCRNIGARLVNLREMPFSEYRTFIQTFWHLKLVEKFENLRRREVDRAFPEQARQDIKKAADGFEKLALATLTLAPEKSAEGGDTREDEDKLRQLVASFGEALKYWPDILAAATAIKASGKVLGRRM